MNPAQTIAETLDRNLTRPTEVFVFGAAALLLDRKFAMGMGGRTTNAIDIIIPNERAMNSSVEEEFSNALEETNRELEMQGLRFAQVAERDVVLTPEWRKHTVALHHDCLTRLALYRLRMLDLVISRTGRGNAQDVADVRSMLRLHREITGLEITGAHLADAATRAYVPDIYREIFPRARERIVAVACELELGSTSSVGTLRQS